LNLSVYEKTFPKFQTVLK